MFKLSSYGPVVAHASWKEAIRAGIGALIGLGLVGYFVLSPLADLTLGLYLIAPFGASSVLLFAVPNSPLAQPWSAIVGNTVGAIVAVAVCILITDPALRIALAVGLAITVTILCRALHPPAGAVAMTAAMSPEAINELGFMFAITPVAVGTILLVIIAMIYGRLTGRHYPFRHFDEPNKHGTSDPEPIERLGLSEDELTTILDRYRQSFNLGAEDLARLIGAAQIQAATHKVNPTIAEDIMSRDIVSVKVDAPLVDIAKLFSAHKFTSLPVVDHSNQFAGIIFQIDLIDQARLEAIHTRRNFLPTLKTLLQRDAPSALRAADIMRRSNPCATPKTPLPALLHLMANGDVDAVSILSDQRLVGIVTRTDMISALSRSALS